MHCANRQAVLAEWGLDFVERGVFTDPREAVFVILGEHKDMEPHADLREENLRRSLEGATNDPRPPIPGEEAMAQIARELAEPRPEPAVWRQRGKQ
jgi:antitoxin ParD1/3/4